MDALLKIQSGPGMLLTQFRCRYWRLARLLACCVLLTSTTLAQTATVDDGSASVKSSGRPDQLVFTSATGSVSSGSDVTVSRWQVGLRTMLPIQPPEKMLMVSPSFEYTRITADVPFDTPEDLYRVGINLMWLQTLNDRWSLSLALNPSLSADRNAFGESVQLFGLAALRWEQKPDRLWWTFGAVHTGRSDIPVLPALGFRWTPSERWDVNIMMPRPKVSYRLTAQAESSTWVYWSGALGGGTWDVERDDGSVQEFSFREFQTVAGYEYRISRFKNLFAEVGAAFGRRLEYEEAGIEESVGEGLFLRCGFTF